MAQKEHKPLVQKDNKKITQKDGTKTEPQKKSKNPIYVSIEKKKEKQRKRTYLYNQAENSIKKKDKFIIYIQDSLTI